MKPSRSKKADLVGVVGEVAVRPGVQAAGGGRYPLPVSGLSGNEKAALWPPFFSETETHAPFPLLLTRQCVKGFIDE